MAESNKHALAIVNAGRGIEEYLEHEETTEAEQFVSKKKELFQALDELLPGGEGESPNTKLRSLCKHCNQMVEHSKHL